MIPENPPYRLAKVQVSLFARAPMLRVMSGLLTKILVVGSVGAMSNAAAMKLGIAA